MAGDWIKMRVDLPDDPAVIAIAAATGLDEDSVVGKLHRLWAWADRHTSDGRAEGLSMRWVDRHVAHEGFGRAMESAGWLEVSESGIVFPHFERHNGQSAKKRAENTTRQRLSRKPRDKSATKARQSCDKSATREEKRREELEGDTPSKTPLARQSGFTKPTTDEVAAYCLERGNGIDAQQFVDHYESNGWKVGKNPMRDWRACVRTWEKNDLNRKPPSAADRCPTEEDLANWSPYGME